MIGSVVGNYKIIDKIGEGGMGAVFKGVDLMLEREVAIKMLRPELARQPSVVERFRTEAVTLAKLNHPNVATLHSFFRQGEDFFMVMEFVRGQTLCDLIESQGALDAGRAIELFCMALEGIEHAHQMGIVHRDIKPANMMLTETGSIKVMDFGIARVLGADRLTKAGHLLGTVEYMSPEQVRGEETDARSDIYSLGVLLYEMLTGRVPFNSTSEYELMRCQIEDPPTPPRVLAPHIPFAVEQAIMCALAKKPEARYQSASEFRTMLIHKTSGSITKVDASPASYVTHESKPIATAPSSGPVIKETTLASDPGVPAALGAELKETRLAARTVGLPAGYQETPPKDFAAQPQSRGSVTSFFGNLNWKHYAGAALALVALVSFPLGFISGGRESSTTQPLDAGQPPAAAPAQSVVPVPNQPIPLPGATSVPAKPDDPAGGLGGARSRNAAGSKPARATQGATNNNAQEKSASAANRAGTAAEKSKTEKVKTAVGGVLKGIGGVLSRKKKPANQQP